MILKSTLLRKAAAFFTGTGAERDFAVDAWLESFENDFGDFMNSLSAIFRIELLHGEKLLSSIDYTSVAGARGGIKTHKANIAKDNFTIATSKSKQYFFKLLSGTKQILCTGETYKTKSRCESAIESVKRFAETAVIVVEKTDGEN